MDEGQRCELGVAVPECDVEAARLAASGLFAAEPVPPLPVYPTYGIDQTNVRRVHAVFGGRRWTEITAANMMQFGYDLSYYAVLDLACRAHYAPAVIPLAMRDETVLEYVLWEAFWICYPWKDDRIHRNVWQAWTDEQRVWVMMCLDIIAENGLDAFDELGADMTRLELQQVKELADKMEWPRPQRRRLWRFG